MSAVMNMKPPMMVPPAQPMGGAGMNVTPLPVSVKLSGIYDHLDENIVDTKVGGNAYLTRYSFQTTGSFSMCRTKRFIAVMSGTDTWNTESQLSGSYDLSAGTLQLKYTDGTSKSFAASYDPTNPKSVLVLGGIAYEPSPRDAQNLCTKPK